MLEWSTPTCAGAPSFATYDGVMVANVNRTAFEDGRWKVEIYSNGTREAGLYDYAGSEARAKEFAERWLVRRLKGGWRPTS